ncbi:hypothetical protein DRO69_06000 [Candidatus Bathyarchaeota archaeon]|nr:MAG: hypothetical protein DRO69_06000 [Candidatus Bathyarchaeota archaeon]
MLRRRLFLLCLLTLMMLNSFVWFTPQANAITVNDVVVKITPPYGNVEHVQTDSEGNIYYGNELGNIYKSTDSGSTWTLWFDKENASENYVRAIFQADNGDFFVYALGTGNPIWKYNGTWTQSFTNVGSAIWHYDQMSNGTILMNPYGNTHNDVLYATDDYGENWRMINLSQVVSGWTDPWHIHSVRVNEYNNDDVWVAIGDDGDEIQLVKYNASGWFLMAKGLQRYWKCDFAFDENYVYFMSDTTYDKITRMPHNGNVTTDQQDVLRSDEWTVGTHFGKWIQNVDGILVALTRHGTIWASWDGEHWVNLQTENANYEPEVVAWYRSKDGAIVVGDRGQNKIIKLYIDEQVLKHLFFKDSVTINGNSVTINHVFKSGSDMAVDLSTYGLSSAQITLQGVSQTSWASNGTFETGDLGGWYERWGTISVTSEDAYEGTYCLNFTPGVKGSIWLNVLPPEFYNSSAGGSGIGFPYATGRVYVVSLWAKSNVSDTDAFAIVMRIKNGTDPDSIHRAWHLNPTDTKWRFYTETFVLPYGYDRVCFYLTNDYANGRELLIDNFQIECYEAQVYDGTGLSRQFLGGWVSSHYNSKTTENPSVTIAGTVKSHSGVLANGTNSTTTSITLPSGILDVTTSVTNSSYVRVIIEGTKDYSITNAIIRNRISSGLYNATYYATPSVTATTNLIIMAEKTSTITSASLTSNQLTFTVSAQSGATSTTQIYTGSKGEPTSVSGASSWSYNSATKILTLTAQHNSPVTITIDWTPQSGGTIPDDDEPFDLDLPDVPSLTIREIYRHIGFLIGILILAGLILYIQNPKKIRRFFRGLLLAKM